MPTSVIVISFLIFSVIVVIDSHLRISKAKSECAEERMKYKHHEQEDHFAVVQRDIAQSEIEFLTCKAESSSRKIIDLEDNIATLSTEIDDLQQNLAKYKELDKRNYINLTRGLAYEIQIGELFGKDAVSVYYRGILRGKKDNGIDLVITTDKEVMLIQCKNYSSPGTLHHASISSFCLSIDGYKAPANLGIHPILVCTNPVSIDWEANVQLRSRNVEIRRIPFDESYMTDIDNRVATIKAATH